VLIAATVLVLTTALVLLAAVVVTVVVLVAVIAALASMGNTPTLIAIIKVGTVFFIVFSLSFFSACFELHSLSEPTRVNPLGLNGL
jgi:hypothetical protein